jgi:hypothetical protein
MAVLRSLIYIIYKLRLNLLLLLAIVIVKIALYVNTFIAYIGAMLGLYKLF